jgi:hypothetical protein
MATGGGGGCIVRVSIRKKKSAQTLHRRCEAGSRHARAHTLGSAYGLLTYIGQRSSMADGMGLGVQCTRMFVIFHSLQGSPRPHDSLCDGGCGAGAMLLHLPQQRNTPSSSAPPEQSVYHLRVCWPSEEEGKSAVAPRRRLFVNPSSKAGC